MNKILTFAVVLVSASALTAADSARIRVDTRQGLFGGKVATRIEAVGEPDGSNSSVWVTTNQVAGIRDYQDGWLVRKVDDMGLKDFVPLAADEVPDHDVLLLNDPLVVGGRLTTNEVWGVETLRIVRHNVVIPSGVTLTIEPEAPVKFTENARIVVEEGGQWIAKGAWFAEIQDDAWFAGDTNMDGDNSSATGTQDWVAGQPVEDYVHVLMLDGAEQVFPTRTYTRGQVYGNLPKIDRYDEGFIFHGWATNQQETVCVEAEQLADMSQPALYACWEAIYLNLSSSLAEFSAYPENEVCEITVDSNDAWKYVSETEWLHVVTNGNVIVITADPNRSETARSTTIVVSRENGKMVREINVMQAAMEHVAQPQILTADGLTTFSDYMAQVWITSATPGATIYYTTDGSEPSVENGLCLTAWAYEGGVAGVINAYKSMTIKAIAVKYDHLDSAVTTQRLVREATLAEAMDVPELYVTTDGDADWKVVKDETFDGVSAVRSGAMTTSASKRHYSRLYMYVEGQGVLTFKWKVSCEKDLTGKCDWDYLAFLADGAVVKKIEGDQDWAEVSYKFTGTGSHVIQWVYTKNAGFADVNPREDCGWIDQVTWTPSMFAGEGADARELFVSPTWLLKVGIVGASATDDDMITAAQADDDGDGFTNEEESILGTDPKDPESKLVTTIQVENGGVKVDYAPENISTEARNLNYRIMGTDKLESGNWKDVTDMTEEQRQFNGFRFFKVKVQVENK